MSIGVLFNQFLQEKQYLQNVSKNTLRFYRAGFKAFNLTEPITQQQLNTRVIQLREKGMSTACLNAYIRSVSSFLRWLFENEYLQTKPVLKKMKCEEKPLGTFTDAQINTLLSYRATKKSESRLLALLSLLVDTGLRIDEALSLRRENVDLENLLIDVVKGKGGKYRRIPISAECRKVLFKHLRSHSHEIVFCNRFGSKRRYDFIGLLDKLGIQVDGSFHAFRRYFATYAIRHNVSVFLIQRQLGHSSLSMTNKYLKLETSDLSRAHISALASGGAR